MPPSCCRCCPNSSLDRVNQSIDSSHRDVIPFIINAFLSCARVAGGGGGGGAHPICALLGSNLDCTVAMLVVRCYCLPGNPDKLGQHVVGHCPAAESDYVVAQAGLQQDARSHPYTLLR